MTEHDLSEDKAKLASFEKKQREYFSFRRETNAERLQRLRNRRATGRLFEQALRRIGLDVESLNSVIATNQHELKRVRDASNAAAENYLRNAKSMFADDLSRRRQALESLLPTPAFNYVTLDRPFWIHFDELDIFTEDHIEPSNSWIKLLIDTNSGVKDRGANFYFMWTNDRDVYAVINITSSLVFTGHCGIAAAPGVFSGSSVELGITAWLNVLRWSGWPPQADGTPLDGTIAPFQQSQYQIVTWLKASAGGFLSDIDYDSAPPFLMTPYDFSYRLLAVAPRATVIFPVHLHVWYGFDNGNDISEYIKADFATNENRIVCPSVLLEVLLTTAPSIG